MNSTLDQQLISTVVDTLSQEDSIPSPIKANKLRNAIGRVDRDITFLQERINTILRMRYGDHVVLENYQSMLHQRQVVANSLKNVLTDAKVG